MIASSAFAFPRDRLFARLDDALRAPLAFVLASPGSGKSTAVREYLANRGLAHVWVNAAPGRAEPAEFLRAFAGAFSTVVPAMRPSVAFAARRLAAGEGNAPIIAWACEHLATVETTVVLDDVEVFADAPDVVALVRELIDATIPRLRWVVIGRHASHLPVARWLANAIALLPVDDADLRVDVDELRQAAASAGRPLSDDELERLHRQTGGSPLGLAVALNTGRIDEPLTHDRLYDGLVDAALAARDADARDALFETALLGRFDGESLVALGRDSATIDELLQAGFVYSVGARACAYHEPYRQRLLARIADEEAPRAAALYARTAAVLEAEGRWTEAIAVDLRSGDADRTAHSLATRGFLALDLGEISTLRDAFAAIPDDVIIRHPIALGMKAALASLDERFDVAEAWFRMAIGAAEHDARREIVLRYGLDLVRRDRSDVIELLEAEASREDDAPSDDAALWALLGTAYITRQRVDDARRAASRALIRLDRLANDGQRGRILHQTSYVALSSRDYVSARDLAERALKTAEASYQYDVAARASSVLFNVAILYEDDVPAGRRALAKLDDAGRKAGNPALRLYATLNAYSLEVDAGDVAAIERLDAELRELQIFLTQMSSESLLPAQALRAAWDGRFEHAYELLAPSADKLFDDDRNAYRWAEIAVYAAACGKRAESDRAVRRSREIVRRCDAVDRLAWRSRAYVAIAEILLAHDGRARSAIVELRALSRRAGPRFNALVDAVRALHARWTTGWHGDPSLAAAFEELERHDLGGVGRFLGALPLPLTDRARFGLLSETEKTVLGMIAAGGTSKEIGADLGRSSQTIDVHVRSICKKLGCSGRRQAVAFALREGLIADRRVTPRSNLR